MRSLSVVLPESMWAEIPIFRTFEMSDIAVLTYRNRIFMKIIIYLD
jgi:hypothetical protein